MPEYSVKFTATIIVSGDMTISADNEDHAEKIAEGIANDMNSDPPLFWQAFDEVTYKAEWGEDSFDVDVTEVL